MRLSLVVATLSVISLAACSSSAPKTPSTPVQANQAQATATQGDTADASQQPRPRKKYCNTGSRLCSDQPDADPTVGAGLASGLSNSTSNAGGGSPH